LSVRIVIFEFNDASHYLVTVPGKLHTEIQPRSRPAQTGFPFPASRTPITAIIRPCARGRAMREEQFPLALRASAHHLNRSRAQAAVQQLPPVGFDQIHVQAGPNGRMARRALRQEQHGYLVLTGSEEKTSWKSSRP